MMTVVACLYMTTKNFLSFLLPNKNPGLYYHLQNATSKFHFNILWTEGLFYLGMCKQWPFMHVVLLLFLEVNTHFETDKTGGREVGKIH